MNAQVPSEDRVKGHGWRDHGEHRLSMGDDRHKVRLFTKGGCKVLVSREDHGKGKERWHLSISREDRYPGWDEIKDARYALLPLGLTFAQILPPPNEYTNIHRNCFHLWEIDHAEW